MDGRHVDEALSAAALAEIYRNRFADADHVARQEAWAAVVDGALGRWIGADDTVLDLGAGRGEFLSAVRCRRKLAVDLNPDAAALMPGDVELVVAPFWRIDPLGDGVVDVVMASNVFEHLNSPAELLATLSEVARVLAPGGRLIVLQPNIRLVGTAYWDFVDHTLPLTEKSLAEAVAAVGLVVEHVRARFLPYTTVGRRVPSRRLVSLYLRLPPARWILGKQTLLVARRP